MSVDQDYHLYFMYNAQANVLEWVSIVDYDRTDYLNHKWESLPLSLHSIPLLCKLDMLPCCWVTVATVSVSLFLKRAIWLRRFLWCFTGRRGDLGYRWVSLQCYSRHKELSATESYFWWICAGKLSTYIIILVTRREAAHALKSKVVTVWINKVKGAPYSFSSAPPAESLLAG